MKVGDLVKMKFRGNGHPGSGLIVATEDREYLILWDVAEWSDSLWREHELVVISENR